MAARAIEPIRYTEPKERSAELLRVALGQMGRHKAAFNPVTFTLWYEYAAGINPALHAAVEQRLQDNAPFGDTVVAGLYQEHIVPPDAAAVQRIGGELQRVMTGLASSSRRPARARIASARSSTTCRPRCDPATPPRCRRSSTKHSPAASR